MAGNSCCEHSLLLSKPRKPQLSSGAEKRKPATPEEMESAAEAAGVLPLYRSLKQSLVSVLRAGYSKTTCFFSGKMSDGTTKVIFSLVPGQSSSEEGLRFVLYSKRLSDFLGIDQEKVTGHLPPSRKEYEFLSNAPEDLRGWTG